MSKVKLKQSIALTLAAMLIFPLIFVLFPTSAVAGALNGDNIVDDVIRNGGSAGGGGTSSGSSTPKPTAKPTSTPKTTAKPSPSPTGPSSTTGLNTGGGDDGSDDPIYYTIYASAGAGGTISPSGSCSVREGYSKTFTITASPGYEIEDVKVDGASKGPVSSVTVYAWGYTTVVASFRPISYTITATATEGGTITPEGTTSVAYGGSVAYVITPDEGAEIVDVLYNGVSQGAVTSFNTGAVTANGAVEAIFVVADTIDLQITSITPNYARVGLHMLSLVTYFNTGNESVNTTLTFSADGSTQEKAITVPAKASGSTVFTWIPTGTGSVQVTAIINPDRTVTETDYTNNTRNDTVIVRPIVDPADPNPTTPVTITPPPDMGDTPYVEWTSDDGTTYWARLTLTIELDEKYSTLKSGYGFAFTVTPKLTTNCPDASQIILPQAVVMRVPESHYETGVTLMKVGDHWELPINPASVIGSKSWFVPVWFPDIDYIGVVTVYGAFTPGGELTSSLPVVVHVDGSMYEDDSTNNAWRG